MEAVFTYDYHQPDSYRFSLDSVMLAKAVAKILSIGERNLEQAYFLDLCAGSGVVGLELQFYLPRIRWMDFVEVQNEYESFFEKNLAMAKEKNKEELNFQFLNKNYRELTENLKFQNKYNFIISNPPYFETAEGLLSPNQFKNRCRFFLDASKIDFANFLIHALAPQGQAFFLTRSGLEHGRNSLLEWEKILKGAGHLSFIQDIRGTQLLSFIKN